MLNTNGTKMAEILSASICTGGFSPCAAFTIFKILASTVSLPTAVIYAFIVPFSIVLPPNKISFIFRCTGTLSPVTMDSFTFASPHNTLQSIGMVSPELIKTMSPTFKVSLSTLNKISL